MESYLYQTSKLPQYKHVAFRKFYVHFRRHSSRRTHTCLSVRRYSLMGRVSQRNMAETCSQF
jgi:hypothetical protein